MTKVIPLKKIKITPKYKYGINEEIQKLPRTVKVRDIVKFIATAGISKDQFYRDREILLGSETSISADRLLIYCKVFDCSIDDLINHEVKATSLRQSIGKKFKTNLR